MSDLSLELQIAPDRKPNYRVSASLTTSASTRAQATASTQMPIEDLEDRLGTVWNAARSGEKSPNVDLTLRALGQALFRTLFTGDVENLYVEALRQSDLERAPLRISLAAEDPELAILPWELLYDVRQDRHLCLSRKTPLARTFVLSTPLFPPLAPPIRMLVLAPRPADLPDTAVALLKESLSRILPPTFQLNFIEDPSPVAIRDALEDFSPHIVHFFGHSNFDMQASGILLALTNEDGKAQWVPADQFGDLLQFGNDLRLVVLVSSPDGGGSWSRPGIAHPLLRSGAAAIIAMQYPITNRAAIVFTDAFYTALSRGQPVEEGITEARIDMRQVLTDTFHWASPVLYSRSSVPLFSHEIEDSELISLLRYHPEPRIARDYWTTEDELEYGQYANAIASFIQHEDTKAPLTIGIKAPWGAGKTSLMRMVQERLDPPIDRGSWEPRQLRLDRRSRSQLLEPVDFRAADRRRKTLWTKLVNSLPLRWFFRHHIQDDAAPSASDEELRRVTNLDILRRARHPVDDIHSTTYENLDVEPPKTQGSLRRKDWRPTVWFNPWMYQSGEQIWAGLAHEIISQITDRLEAADRERFWLELNMRRVDKQAVRRKVYRALVERFLPLAVGLLVALALAVAGTLLAYLVPSTGRWIRTVSAAVVSFGGLSFGAGALIQTLHFFREGASGSLEQLVHEPKLVAGSEKILSDELKGSLASLFPDPGYEGRLGFFYLVHTDMKRVLDLVATRERPLVVFVDDLDRCSPGAVAQVIEAINLFLAGEFPNCIFVLAVEPAVVAAHVEVAYKELVDSLKEGGRAHEWTTLGWRFLEKIVQLPLSLPLPDDKERVDGYITSLLRMSDQAPYNSSGLRDASERIDFDAPESAQERTGERKETLEIVRTHDPALRFEAIARLEDAIRRRSPTIDNLPELARAAQDEVLGPESDPERLTAETIEAANRVFPDLYSDTASRQVILGALPSLESKNPREIKRFVNLYRFYTFIAQHERLRGAPALDDEQVAKLAVLAIRWPHLLHAFSRPMERDGGTVLSYLEQQARVDKKAIAVNESQGGKEPSGNGDGGEEREDADTVYGWREALVRSGLTRDAKGSWPEDASWSEDLRHFLSLGPIVGPVASRFL